MPVVARPDAAVPMLEILERRLATVDRGATSQGIYILIHGDRAVYVGSSGNVWKRVRTHAANARLRPDSPKSMQFDRAIWFPVDGTPYGRMIREGNLIRILAPVHNKTAPIFLASLEIGMLTKLGILGHPDVKAGKSRWRERMVSLGYRWERV